MSYINRNRLYNQISIIYLLIINTLQYTIIHYNTLQYTTIHYNTLQYKPMSKLINNILEITF